MGSVEEKLTIVADLWEELGIENKLDLYQEFIDLLAKKKFIDFKFKTIYELEEKIPNLTERILKSLNGFYYRGDIKEFYFESNEIVNNTFIVSYQNSNAYYQPKYFMYCLYGIKETTQGFKLYQIGRKPRLSALEAEQENVLFPYTVSKEGLGGYENWFIKD